MSATDNWQTPPKLMAALDKEFNFNLEVCAAGDNRALVGDYMGLDNGCNALTSRWFSTLAETRAYMNPPYSDVYSFMARAGEEMKCADGPNLIVSLIPADIATSVWWEHILPSSTEIRFLQGRQRFWDKGKPGPYVARFSSAVVVMQRKVGKSYNGPAVTWWNYAD